VTVTSIDLCSRALVKIGASSISSFDEGTAEAHVAASIYPAIRDGLLSAHPWNFAIAQRRLAKLAASPVADYESGFALPEDSLRIISAGAGARGRGLAYRIQQRTLYTNAEDVVLTYVFRAAEADFPPFFNLALIARLAAEFCIPLTDSTSRWASLYKIAEDELRRARLTDAQEDTPPYFEDFTLTEGRG
jgi:hypothetical protein